MQRVKNPTWKCRFNLQPGTLGKKGREGGREERRREERKSIQKYVKHLLTLQIQKRSVGGFVSP